LGKSPVPNYKRLIMPIYEYQCKLCEAEFEYLIEGSAKAVCPKCESKKVERQLSMIASPQASSSQSCGTPLPGGGCSLPQCGSRGGGGGG